MISAIIRWSLRQHQLVMLGALIFLSLSLYSLGKLPLDAIPDLSDVQVIIKTSYPGHAPAVVEDQITYPLTSALLSVPAATTVRGYSFFGDSYIYLLFEDGTDPYWARSRVLEFLEQGKGQLPSGVEPALAPDASGVGWVYQYALVDRSGQHDLSQLRSLQDWFLKLELQGLPGVAEVATVGGMVKEYQVVLDIGRMRAHELSLSSITQSIRDNNREVGGSVVEIAEAEYMVRGRGYISDVDDLARIPYLDRREAGAPLLLQDFADVRLGPAPRRGVADLDGKGEVVGGIVVMRSGANALDVIERVKARLAELEQGLPENVELVSVYDRAPLIIEAVNTLGHRLVEEFIGVLLVCLVFLLHLRAGLVVLFTLPVAIFGALAVMQWQGMSANILSLGGIAIAVGAMMDAAIVMIEHAHKRLEQGGERVQAIREAMVEVGPAIFTSLLIVTVSFLPVLALEDVEGRLFTPLAYTKTYAMALAAALSLTLVPVLSLYLLRGRIRSEEHNPLNRFFLRIYRPLLGWSLGHPRQVIGIAIVATLFLLWPLSRLGGEFMPPLEEGDLLYMPTTQPGISIGKARQLLQQTDGVIRTLPEVASVFGKVGRADTATDPAPLNMIETTIRLKPKDQWRPGMTREKLVAELDERLQLPGLTNAWLMPISARIDMLETGVRTPVGVRVTGPDLTRIQELGSQIEAVLKPLAGSRAVFAERPLDGRYIEIEVDRDAAAHFGMNLSDVHQVIETGIGGTIVDYTVEGRERYPINVRYPREVRDSVAKLRDLPVFLESGEQIRLKEVARVEVRSGPATIKSENARLTGWVYVDVDDPNLAGYVARARTAVEQQVVLPPGYAIAWSGRYAHLIRAQERLAFLVPLTLALVVLLLYAQFRSTSRVFMVLSAIPPALIGAFWLLYLLDFRLSVAVAVGFIALIGVVVEFGVVMLLYLDRAMAHARPRDRAGRQEAIMAGAVLRLRPKLMTVASLFAGLLPIMLGDGAGSEMMQRIAAPMLGGMLSAPLVSLFLIPVLYQWLEKGDKSGAGDRSTRS
jgi:copper/silver efflux system protein